MKNKLLYLPTAYPFSDFDFQDDNKAQQFGDGGCGEEKMYSDMNTEFMVLKVLSQLKDRHKIVFMFLLLRENGYKLTHEECARTMMISRQAYARLVKSVKNRSAKLLQDGEL